MPTFKLQCKGCHEEMVPYHVEAKQLDWAYTAPSGASIKIHHPGVEGEISISSLDPIRIEGTLEQIQEQLSQGIDARCPRCNATHHYAPEDYLV